MPDKSMPRWRKSTRCSNGGCVEVADAGAVQLVRDSKDPDSPILEFGRDQWTAFVAALRADEFTS